MTTDGNKADGGLHVLQRHISPYRKLEITFYINDSSNLLIISEASSNCYYRNTDVSGRHVSTGERPWGDQLTEHLN